MKRRKFILGAGALAAGGAAAMGTGAFAVDAEDRDAEGTISNDNSAYLSLKPGDYSSIGGDGQLDVELNRLNSNAVTQLDDVFFIENTGSGPVDVGVNGVSTPSDISVESVPVTTDNGSVGGSDLGSDLLGNVGGATLSVGEEIGVGVEIETDDIPAGQSADASFHVDADSA